jgi:hypothetical protein
MWLQLAVVAWTVSLVHGNNNNLQAAIYRQEEQKKFSMTNNSVFIRYSLKGWRSDVSYYFADAPEYGNYVTAELQTAIRNVENTAPIIFLEEDNTTTSYTNVLQFRLNLCFASNTQAFYYDRQHDCPNNYAAWYWVVHSGATFATEMASHATNGSLINFNMRVERPTDNMDVYNIANSFAHEIGHALGFKHPWRSPEYNTYVVCPNRTTGNDDRSNTGEFPDWRSVMWYSVLLANDNFNSDEPGNVDCDEMGIAKPIMLTEQGLRELGNYDIGRIGTEVEFSDGDRTTINQIYNTTPGFYANGTKAMCSKFGVAINGVQMTWSQGRQCVRPGNYSVLQLPDCRAPRDVDDFTNMVVISPHQENDSPCRHALTRQMPNAIHVMRHQWPASSLHYSASCRTGWPYDGRPPTNLSFFCVSHEDLDYYVGSNGTVEISCLDTHSHAICDGVNTTAKWTDFAPGYGDSRPISGSVLTQRDAAGIIVAASAVGALMVVGFSRTTPIYSKLDY